MKPRVLVPVSLVALAIATAVINGAAIESAVLASQSDDRPVARRHHALTYDTRSERVVLYGGVSDDNQFLDDLWSWDGNRWTLVARPAPSAGGAMYSDEHGNLILVAGTRGDTSMFDGTGWTTIVPEPSRCCMAGAYDRPRNRFVLHGGSPAPGHSAGDTLEFDGTAWRRVTIGGPSPRMQGAMAFDAARGVAVHFGGASAETPVRRFGDHWEWDGVMWRQPDIGSERPPARNAHGMAYDAARREIVMFGGFAATGELLADTWLFNGGQWRRADVEGPSPRADVFLAYDARREVVVLFGGLDDDRQLADTWEWDGSRWTRRDVPSEGDVAHRRWLRVESRPSRFR